MYAMRTVIEMAGANVFINIAQINTGGLNAEKFLSLQNMLCNLYNNVVFINIWTYQVYMV